VRDRGAGCYLEAGLRHLLLVATIRGDGGRTVCGRALGALLQWGKKTPRQSAALST